MMKFLSASALLGAVLTTSAHAKCPGSKAFVHAKCDMGIFFPNAECRYVQEEIKHRMNGEYGWSDPHNRGEYSILSETSSNLQGSRLTGNKQYTDLFEFDFVQQDDGCHVHACSESQVTSVLDFSTNYCNLHNLYCSASKEGCPVAQREFDYLETYRKCSQRDTNQCLSSLTTFEMESGGVSFLRGKPDD